jgi:hypothetical protein
MLLLVKAAYQLRLDRREVPWVRRRSQTDGADQRHRLVDDRRSPFHTVSHFRGSGGSDRVKTHANAEQPLANEIKECTSLLFTLDHRFVGRQLFALHPEIANRHGNHGRGQRMKMDVDGKQFARLVSALQNKPAMQRSGSWCLVKLIVQSAMASAPSCLQEKFDFAADQIGRTIAEQISKRLGRKNDRTIAVNDRRAISNSMENGPNRVIRREIACHGTIGWGQF